MGITERKEREKKEMRQLILSTAAKQFMENGFEKTSIRNIADAIEYSPTTIYLYFKDKNDLFYSLSEEGFIKFFHAFKSVNDVVNPLERLRLLGEAYIKFALENAELYDLMFILRAPMDSHRNQEGWDQGMKSHGVLTSAVHECVEQGIFKEKDEEKIAFMIWSFVHGAVCFKIRERMRMFEEKDHEEILKGSLAIFNEMLSHL